MESVSDLRGRWQQIDIEMLRSWVMNREQEDLQLDCKLLSNPPEFDRNDRKTFATAVSGFANSAGGILMWGVDARKDRDTGIDSVVQLVPIASPERVCAALNSLTGTATSPIVEGVEHRIVPGDVETGGFIATLVPPSDLPPHMAKFGENRYYKRSGDSFYQMEHFDIADMFGRRAMPVLEVVLHDGVGSYLSEECATYEPVIAIRNSGRAAARYPFLRIELGPPYGLNRQFGLRGGETGLPERPQFDRGVSAIFGGGADHVIHAGTRLDIQRIEKRNVSLAYSTIESLTIDYQIACDGMSLRSGRIERTGQQIIEFVQNEVRKKYPSCGV